MGLGDDGKFKKRTTPAVPTPGEDASGTGATGYEEPIEPLATPVAAASMPALPSGAGAMSAEDTSIKNGDSVEGQARGAGEGKDGTNDEVETIVSMWAAFKHLEQQLRKERAVFKKGLGDQKR